VKSHPWLKNFPWTKLENKEIEAPYVPIVFPVNNSSVLMTTMNT